MAPLSFSLSFSIPFLPFSFPPGIDALCAANAKKPPTVGGIVPDVDWLGLYLQEDLGPRGGPAGDITSAALFADAHQGKARIVARERAFLAGARHALEVFRRLGCTAHENHRDGQWVEAGGEVMRVQGPATGILAGERLALNLLACMSGVATATREAAEILRRDGGKGVPAGTRKTTPGFRVFEKEAIRIGGGEPHRMGLYDEAMVKDNHREALGGATRARGLVSGPGPEVGPDSGLGPGPGTGRMGVGEAVRRVRDANPGKVVTCEVESLPDALEAAAAGADWLLIDNQSAEVGEAWAKEVRSRHAGVRIEASGGIHPGNLAGFGWADRVSLGWLTQKAPGKDFSLEWDT